MYRITFLTPYWKVKIFVEVIADSNILRIRIRIRVKSRIRIRINWKAGSASTPDQIKI